MTAPEALDELQKWLVERDDIELESQRRERRTSFDTFDWRLWRKGLRLQRVRRLGKASDLELRSAGELVAALPWSGRTVRFATDLPEDELEAARKAIGVRRLFGVVELATRLQTYRVLAQEQKTVAWLTLQVSESLRENRRKDTLTPRLSLEPLVGYANEASAFVAVLQDLESLRSGGPTAVEEALQGRARPLGAYRAKPEVAMAPESPTGGVAAKILSQLLSVVEENDAGVVKDWDVEFLHDHRVASRRARSLLSQLESSLPAAETRALRQELKWLGSLTGPVRDLDVLLLQMPRFESRLVEPIRPHLAPLTELNRRRRVAARRRLLRALRSRRYEELGEVWRRAIKACGEGGKAPIGEVAAGRIRRSYRKLRKLRRRLAEPPEFDDLHRMRIEGKKLRYLLEFFAPLYPADVVADMIGKLKSFQDELGAINDASQQIDLLAESARTLARDPANVAAVLAIGRLLARLERRREKSVARVLAAFDGFDSKSRRQAVGALGEGSPQEVPA